jgi:hypothetical protein
MVTQYSCKKRWVFYKNIQDLIIEDMKKNYKINWLISNNKVIEAN